MVQGEKANLCRSEAEWGRALVAEGYGKLLGSEGYVLYLVWDDGYTTIYSCPNAPHSTP